MLYNSTLYFIANVVNEIDILTNMTIKKAKNT